MKKISSREFMYIGGILVLPIIMLFKGMPLYFLGGIVLSSVLIMLDPLFKRFRKQIDGADKFIVIILFTGATSAGVTMFFPNSSMAIVLSWSAFYVFYGIKMSGKIEKMNSKISE